MHLLSRPPLSHSQTDTSKRKIFSLSNRFRSKTPLPDDILAKHVTPPKLSDDRAKDPLPISRTSSYSSDLSVLSRQSTLVDSFDTAPVSVYSPSGWKYPHVRVVYSSLRTALAKQNIRVEEGLDADDLFSGRLWYSKEDRLNSPFRGHHKKETSSTSQHVFGSRLDVIACNPLVSTTVNVAGFEHTIPTIVFACVERLRRSNLDEPGLFESASNRNRVLDLSRQFNTLSPTIPFPDLSNESTNDVAILLKIFISTFPLPLFHRQLLDALWLWSISPSIKRDRKYRHNFRARMVRDDEGGYRSASDDSAEDDDLDHPHGDGLAALHARHKQERKQKKEQKRRRETRAAFKQSEPEAYYAKHAEAKRQRESDRAKLDEQLKIEEHPQIAIARLLLMLLPPDAFSFIVYFFNFLEGAKGKDNAGLSYEKMGALFGYKIFGGGNPDTAAKMMAWVLERWSRIAKGFAKKTRAGAAARSRPQDSQRTLLDKPESPVKEKSSLRTVLSATDLEKGDKTVDAASSLPSTPTKERPRILGQWKASSLYIGTSQGEADSGSRRKVSMQYTELKEGDQYFPVGIY